MLTSILFAPALAAQVAFVPQPMAPAAPSVDSEYFQRSLERQRERLTDQCMSPEGIEIVLEARIKNQRAQTEEPQQWRDHEEAVAQAAWAQPFDPEAMTKAVKARAEFRAQRELDSANSSLETFARLSPQDQKIFAHGMTGKVAQGYQNPC